MFKCQRCSVYVEDINRDLWMCLECAHNIEMSVFALAVIVECVETFKDCGLFTNDGKQIATAAAVKEIYTVLNNRLKAVGGTPLSEETNERTIKCADSQHGQQQTSAGETETEEIPTALGNC